MADTEARIRISAENRTKAAFDEIKRSMIEVQSAGDTLRGALAGVGTGLSVVGIAAFVKSGIDAADSLDDLSQRVGVTVESLSALRYAAEFGDVSMEQLSNGLRQLAKNASEAQSGTGDAAKAFTALGVAVTDSGGQLKGTEELLLEVAEKFQGIEDGAGKTALAMKIFGRSGADLIPLLNLGRTGFEQLRAEAERLGIVISGDTAKAAAAFNDDLTRLSKGLDALKFSLAAGVLPELSKFTNELVAAARAAGGLFGGIFVKAATDTSDINREIAKVTQGLAKLREQRDALAGSGALARLNRIISPEDLKLTEIQIKGFEQRLAFLNDLQRQRGGAPTDADPTFSFPGGRRAPVLGGDDKAASARAARDSEEQKAAAQREKNLRDAVAGTLQAQEDANIALSGALEEESRIKLKRFEESKRIEEQLKKEAEAVAQAIDPTRKYYEEIKRVAELVNLGYLDPELGDARLAQLNAEIAKYQELKVELQETDNFARDLGLTFSSAFEDAIVQGKGLSDVLKSLGQDIARIITRKAITEPLADGIGGLFKTSGIGDFFGSLFKNVPGRAIGGPVSGGSPYMVGELGPELFVPNSSGRIVPNNALGGGGPIFNVDMRGASVEAVSRLERLVQQVNGSIESRALGAMRGARARGIA